MRGAYAMLRPTGRQAPCLTAEANARVSSARCLLPITGADT
ncbi:hypothetical protein [Streptomyces sp. NPDC057238]